MHYGTVEMKFSCSKVHYGNVEAINKFLKFMLMVRAIKANKCNEETVLEIPTLQFGTKPISCNIHDNPFAHTLVTLRYYYIKFIAKHNFKLISSSIKVATQIHKVTNKKYPRYEEFRIYISRRISSLLCTFLFYDKNVNYQREIY